jgi:hypothetical protein
MDVAVLLARTARVAWRTFLLFVRLVWRVCDLPARLLVPARFPWVRALVAGALFVVAVVALDVAVTGRLPSVRR